MKKSELNLQGYDKNSSPFSGISSVLGMSSVTREESLTQSELQKLIRDILREENV